MESPEKNADIEFEATEKLSSLRWDEARERTIFDVDRQQESDRYLHVVDNIQQSVESITISTSDRDHPSKMDSFAMQITMVRLQDEFRNILITHTNPIETDALNYPNSSTPSMTSPSESNAHSNETEIDMLDNFNSSTRSSSVTESSADFRTARDQSTYGSYLEDEILFNGEEFGEWSSISCRSSISVDDEPSEAIYNLRSIAKRMITSGYQSECIQAYVSIRKPIVASNFRCLGFERLSVGDDHRLGWDALELDIRWWIRGAKVCVRILFAREKRLCEEIFEGEALGTVANDACFMETVKGPVIQLFDFPKAVSNSQRSHVELYMILDLHVALTDILSDVDVLFRSNSSESIRVQAVETLSKLAEAARERLTEFENVVLNDGTTNPLFGGIIHPLTRYVIDYILLISAYTKTMKELIVTNPSMGSWISGDPMSPEIDFPELEDQSPFSLHLIWIILILQFKLEEKSKYYKDASLSHIFLMNNIHYIIQKIRGYPKLHKIIGNDCLKKLTLKFRQAMIDYVRSTWVGILFCLRDEGLQGGSLTVKERKMRIRERFKTFNSMFEKVHRVQASWLVPDPQLREELQISISEKLIPAYRCFLRWLRVSEDPKYSVEDLEIAVLDFFEGHPVSLNRRKRLYNFMTNQGNSNRDPN